MDMSQLTEYSVGIVAENKSLKSWFVEVVPIEHVSFVDGELTSDKETYEASSKDNGGQDWKAKINSSNSIKAEWLPLGNTNRKTAPDVRRGEQVVLYRFGDTDKFYWVDYDSSKKLRRLETAVFAFSNNSVEGTEDTADTTYFFEVSTHRKLVHLHTSKNDGEKYAYDLQIDAKNGIVTIQDDDENYIQLTSKERRIKLENRDHSYVDINKKEIFIKATERIRMDSKVIEIAGSEKITETTRDYSRTSVNAILSETNYARNTVSYRMTLGSYILNSNTVPVIGGGLQVSGNLSVSGNSNISGASYANPHFKYAP